MASQRLEPGTTYDLKVTGRGEDGKDATLTRSFTTENLTLKQQTYPSVAPLQGETVGVGMPVIVTFDVPVKNRALFERNMSVQATPAVEGSWDWFSDREVHFRPEHFWKAGTKVKVVLRLNGLPAGDGIYGQQDQVIDFNIGREAISTVDVRSHQLTYTVDGKKVRTIPVSSGDAQHQSREGTKIIMEKFSRSTWTPRRPASTPLTPATTTSRTSAGRCASPTPVSSCTLRHGPTPSRVTSTSSHGCTGMSTANADWLYHHSRRGDVVKFIHSPQAAGGSQWLDRLECPLEQVDRRLSAQRPDLSTRRRRPRRRCRRGPSRCA